MHSSYTNRRDIKTLLCMINTLLVSLASLLTSIDSNQYTISYSTWTIKGSLLLSAFWFLVSIARFVFTTSSPRTVNVHAPATLPKCFSSPSLITPLMLESSLWSENVTYCPHVVRGCGIQNMYHKKSTIELADMGLSGLPQ